MGSFLSFGGSSDPPFEVETEETSSGRVSTITELFPLFLESAKNEDTDSGQVPEDLAICEVGSACAEIALDGRRRRLWRLRRDSPSSSLSLSSWGILPRWQKLDIRLIADANHFQ